LSFNPARVFFFFFTVIFLLFAMMQPDEKVEPFFDSLVRQTGVEDIFSIRLCGVTDFESNVGMDGTLVSVLLNINTRSHLKVSHFSLT